MTTTAPEPRRLSDEARATFDAALGKSVDALFRLPDLDAAAVIDEFLAGRLIVVLTRTSMYVRPVEDADLGPTSTPKDDDTPGTGMFL